MESNQYTWRTVEDSKVRSSHTGREGKVFSWKSPPEGGHPGEDYNCRCWAEEGKCLNLAMIAQEALIAEARTSAQEIGLNRKVSE